MSDVTRRGLLARAAAAGGTVLGLAGAGVTGPLAGPATASPPTAPRHRGLDGRSRAIRADDPRYADLVLRGTNRRFVGQPDEVFVATSTEDVVRAVEHAVRAGRRIAVRGGGHCFEDFVDNPEVEVVLDMSRISEVTYDHRHRAFSIGAGATLDRVYTELYYGWGVTVPGGGCLGVGVGGHFSGGGYGPLSRLHGSVVDHLYGVEVVVVDRSGHARAVVATRDPRDPHHDLWWAHTGGGGGNFGVVTRYLMRSTGVSGADPHRALPKPPESLLTNAVLWDWKSVTKASFTRTLQNVFRWYEQHAGADSPYASLYSPFLLSPSAAGGFLLSTQIDAGIPDARKRLDTFNAAVIDGVDPAPYVTPAIEGPFLSITRARSIQETVAPTRAKYKAAYLRRGYSVDQIGRIYDALTDPDYHNPASTVLFVPYGGKVNTVAPSATATAQRDSIMKAVFTASWENPADDAANLTWVRELYRDLYAETGGVPVSNETNDGSYINYPDVDLADPAWNTSGVPWHTLYYKDNYPRLQRVKARWDPRNVFRHKLSIEQGG